MRADSKAITHAGTPAGSHSSWWTACLAGTSAATWATTRPSPGAPRGMKIGCAASSQKCGCAAATLYGEFAAIVTARRPSRSARGYAVWRRGTDTVRRRGSVSDGKRDLVLRIPVLVPRVGLELRKHP